MLSPFLFEVVVDVVIEFAREGALSEFLCDEDLVLMSETIKFLKWKKALESKALKRKDSHNVEVNLTILPDLKQWCLSAYSRKVANQDHCKPRTSSTYVHHTK